MKSFNFFQKLQNFLENSALNEMDCSLFEVEEIAVIEAKCLA